MNAKCLEKQSADFIPFIYKMHNYYSKYANNLMNTLNFKKVSRIFDKYLQRDIETKITIKNFKIFELNEEHYDVYCKQKTKKCIIAHKENISDDTKNQEKHLREIKNKIILYN